jgi:hypothetical protein
LRAMRIRFQRPYLLMLLLHLTVGRSVGRSVVALQVLLAVDDGPVQGKAASCPISSIVRSRRWSSSAPARRLDGGDGEVAVSASAVRCCCRGAHRSRASRYSLYSSDRELARCAAWPRTVPHKSSCSLMSTSCSSCAHRFRHHQHAPRMQCNDRAQVDEVDEAHGTARDR